MTRSPHLPEQDGARRRTRTPSPTRELARAAVRASLARTALDLFQRDGFDGTTFDDLATAAGVSRSTVLRYFGSKEDAVLWQLEADGREVANVLRHDRTSKGDWEALRAAFDVLLERYRRDPEGSLAITRLIQSAPSLCARQLEQTHDWVPALAEALGDRSGVIGTTEFIHTVRATAALDCLSVAITEWAETDGREDLSALVDRAFQALA